jgi:hypothetical protein
MVHGIKMHKKKIEMGKDGRLRAETPSRTLGHSTTPQGSNRKARRQMMALARRQQKTREMKNRED